MDVRGEAERLLKSGKLTPLEEELVMKIVDLVEDMEKNPEKYRGMFAVERGA